MFFNRSKSSRPRSASKATRRVLRVESLEARQMMHGEGLGQLSYGVELDDVLATEMAPPATVRVHTVPQLSSRPGAPATLYLDFNGHFQSSFAGYDNITTPPFDRDGNTAQLSADEVDAIRQIWASVTEDFSPFNLNVTTIDPGNFSNSSTNLRLAIGGQNFLTQPASGVAEMNSFTNSCPNIGFAFDHRTDGTTYSVRKISEVASHEAGHAFGLYHQSTYNNSGVKVEEYNEGDSLIAPIMGDSDTAERGLWMRGPSQISATFPLSPGEGQYLILQGARYILGQDDLARLARSANGFGYRADDHGATFNQATPLTVVDHVLAGNGVIEKTSDKDIFKFETGGGLASIAVSGAVYRSIFTYASAPVANLDMTVELRSANGALITSANAYHSHYEVLTADLAPGAYYLVVGSNGAYGDVGQYTVEVREGRGPRVVSAERGQLNESLDVIHVTFNEMIDAATFTPADVSLGSGPFAPTIISVSPRIDGDGRMFTIVYTKPTIFDVQSVTIGPNITDLFGNLMNQDGDSINGELEDRFVKSFLPPLDASSSSAGDAGGLQPAAVDYLFATDWQPRKRI